MSEIKTEYDAKVIEKVESLFKDGFENFVIAEDEVGHRTSQKSVDSLVRYLNNSKDALVYYQTTPYEQISKEYFENYNTYFENSKESLAKSNEEKKLLEDSLDKISKMTFSREGLFDSLVSYVTDQINYMDDNIKYDENRIAEIEEREENFDVQKHVNDMVKLHQEQIEDYEDLILQTERFIELNDESYQEFNEQLDN